ncbi:MAG: type IV pilus modification PilV family protein [Candidatus Caldatribacteriaceae bacterium]
MGRRLYDQGATLLEVILVVAILGFGISATSILFSANLRSGTSNREQLACATLVTDVMERLRSIPFKANTGKSIESLAQHLDSNGHSLLSFYNYLEVPNEERNALIAAIPRVFDFSTLTLSKSTQEYEVQLNVQWKENMTPVIVKNLIVEGGLNDLLQPE